MNQPALPAHLQNRQSRHLAETATQGMGGAQPPHISIRGNQFRLVDATGNEQPVLFTAGDGRQYAQPYLDVCIVDLSDVICKQFYPPDKPWTPDSNDPPTCWSANGIGPSRDAPTPQCRTCAECEWNKRGSAISKISGAAIKACRDEKWTAVVIPGFDRDMVFQLKITPGSFDNWKGYVEKFKGTQVDIPDIVTRLEFQQGVNGVLVFNVSPAGYIDAPTAALSDRVLAARTTDIFVGRTDQPITSLAAPAAQPALPAPAPLPGPQYTASVPLAPAAPAGFQPAPAPTFAPPPAPSAPPASYPPQAPAGQASFQIAQTGPVAAYAPAAGGATMIPQPAPRRRRTRAQIEAANAAQQPAPVQRLPMDPTAMQQGQTPVQAPFRPAPPVGQPVSHPQPVAAAPAAPFGVAPAPGPGPALAAMLDQHFGPAGGPPR